jgi:hypothetical protein
MPGAAAIVENRCRTGVFVASRVPLRVVYEHMFPSLAAEIETLVVPADGSAIVAAVALRDRLDARIAAAVGAFAAVGGHEVEGAVTLGSWLGHRAGLDPTAARREASRGHRLQRLPVLRSAFLDGRLSAGAVEAVLAKVPRRHLDRFADHEAELVPLLCRLDVLGIAKAMADWRAKADALDPGPEPVELPDTLRVSATLEDRGVLTGSLGTDSYNVVATTLRVFDCGDHTLPLAERQALALVQACQTALDHNPAAKRSRQRPHLTVTLRDGDPATATYLDTGMPVSRPGIATLMCDAVWHRMRSTDRATILRYGRTTRDWPPELANAIAIRDGGCRWPGCHAPTHWCDIHHLHHWEDGGPTDIDNGLLLCRRHHRRLHARQGWTLKLLPDATTELTHPDGHTETSHPSGLDPPRLPTPPA